MYNDKKAKVYVYGPDIPVGSADFILITPRQSKSLFHSLISFGKIMKRNFLQLGPCTQYQLSLHLENPLLLAGQRLCGFNAYPRLLHMVNAAGTLTQFATCKIVCSKLQMHDMHGRIDCKMEIQKWKYRNLNSPCIYTW